jgi:hypothetical protein
LRDAVRLTSRNRDQCYDFDAAERSARAFAAAISGVSPDL